MNNTSMKEAIYAQIVADTEKLGVPPFESNVMAEKLRFELMAQWNVLPDSTRLLLMECIGSLKKHHVDDIISSSRTTDVVNSLRARNALE